jgi:hypothetical protein
VNTPFTDLSNGWMVMLDWRLTDERSNIAGFAAGFGMKA